jgi:Putative zinc-finger
MSTQHHNACQVEDVAAYLDGELTAAAHADFELHVQTCLPCTAELRSQQQLLCALDSAFSDASRAFALPTDFARVVAVRAESDMSGVRDKGERRGAVRVCVLLALGAFALLGAASSGLVFEPVRTFMRGAGTVIEFAGRTVYDAGSGIAVILRLVVRAFVFDSHGVAVLFILPLAIAGLLLPRLIARYHRAQIIEQESR